MAKKIQSVLLVDDDPIVNHIHTLWIKKTEKVEDIQVVLNGKEALDFLIEQSEHGHTGFPELIFLDINMPVMDGWEFLEEYRNIRRSMNLPLCKIYMLTSSPNPDDEARALKIPEVDGYFHKPISQEVMEVLSK